MREIFLNKGHIVLIDEEDFDLVNKYKWYVCKNGYAAGTAEFNGIKIPTLMHRLILGLTNFKNQVDHINHNKLDNRRCNLRICNNAENQRNVTPSGRSKYLGVAVYYRKNNNRTFITAQIKVGEKKKHLGYFKTEEEAAKVYDNAAKIYHGEFANLNFKECLV